MVPLWLTFLLLTRPPLLQMVPPFFLHVPDTYLQQWFTCPSQVDTLLYLCPYSVGYRAYVVGSYISLHYFLPCL